MTKRIADLDRRVEALLTDPEHYFAAARERARTTARAEVEADLARRARARQNHQPIPAQQPGAALRPPP